MRCCQRTEFRIDKSWTRDKWKFAPYGEIIDKSNRTNYLFDSLNSYNAKTGQTSVTLDTMLPSFPPPESCSNADFPRRKGMR